jgi:hypothetical protein
MPKDADAVTKMIARIPTALFIRFKKSCIDRKVTMRGATEEALRAWLKKERG